MCRATLIAAAASFTIGAASAQVIWTSNPTADAFVKANNPTSNYGAAGALMVAGSASGSGVFETLVKFNLAAAKAQFDTQYGAGNWTITGATLRLAGNVATQGSTSSNFPAVSGGGFGITWLANDTWTEGTGTPGAPTSTGVTYSALATLTGLSDVSLGSFTYVPPGNNVQLTWTLPVSSSGFSTDLAAGGDVSLLFAPGDTTVSYLFNSRSYGTSANWPLLSVTAVPEPSAAALLLVAAGLSRLLVSRWRTTP